jgi:hypothetical protein
MVIDTGLRPDPDPEPGPSPALKCFGVHHRGQEKIGDRAGFRAREALGGNADDLDRAVADTKWAICRQPNTRSMATAS